MGTGAYSQRWQELFDPPQGIRLASATGPGTGSGTGTGENGDLVHAAGPWTKAASAAGELRTSTGGALSRMSLAHDGLAAGTAGLASAGALATVRASWEKRLTAVRDECGALDPMLLKVARDLGEVDEQGRVAFSRLAVRTEPAK
ncbi:hypothetical protein OHS33_20385 [Streptomyces sp. NBC_00536]|uniref:hypothetical protein n=1 Tax=Streptomyces sp. NBC_00536 TaxID=2975769 RepID=UPI002E804758|nr:hypothetical protein [Streptomyces sp. NBC_00536]WUC80473.1 hypothetical protein OHS33_20385 [Streptomyces sp. NBC_00536]